MSAEVRHTQVIDRPIDEVFRFLARDHVRNHPRWDPSMSLEQVTAGPIEVGTVIRRRHTHGGTPVEGTMEVVAFEENAIMGVVIHDGPMKVRSSFSFRSMGPDRTEVAIQVELPGLEPDADLGPLREGIAQSAREQRRLIEARR